MYNADRHHAYVTPLNPRMRDMLVEQGATYYDKKKYCKLPRTMSTLNSLYRLIPEIREDKAYLEDGWKLKNELDQLAMKRNQVWQAAPGDRLRPYQRKDVQFLQELDAAGIFNDPRTGKTPTTLEMLRTKGTKRNLVVCPASLLYTWAKQSMEWFPEASVYVVDGKKNFDAALADFDHATKNQNYPAILIISKNMLANIEDFYKIQFDVAVVDEAHFLRNRDSNQSKAVMKIKADQRFALTGTPTVKHPSDIFGILQFLFPKDFTSYWNFCNWFFYVGDSRYSRGNVVGPPRAGREEHLQELVSRHSVFRKRSEVMPWLPKKEHKTLYAKMNDKQSKAYYEMEKLFFTECEETGAVVDAATILVKLIRLRQLSIDPRMVGFKTKGAKTEMLLQLLKDRKEDDNPTPLIVMSTFTSYLKLLQDDLTAAGYRVDTIHGEMTATAKQAAADAFQRGEVDILLCNIKSAGVGWTLDRGDTIVFVDSEWNPSDNEQAEDRVTPTTPENLHKHEVVHLSAMGTVDEKIFDLLRQKKSLTDIINQGAAALLNTLRG